MPSSDSERRLRKPEDQSDRIVRKIETFYSQEDNSKEDERDFEKRARQKDGSSLRSRGSTQEQTRNEASSSWSSWVFRYARAFLLPWFSWVLTVAWDLRYLVALTVAVYMVYPMTVFAWNTSTRYALSSLCNFPVIPWVLPACKYSPPLAKFDGDATTNPPVDFDRLTKTHNKFEEILEESVTSLSLPRQMRRSDALVRDLRTVVQWSQLPSRNQLVTEFDSFSETARMTASRLTKFNSRVGSSVDSVLANARSTKSALDEVVDRSRNSKEHGALSSLLRIFFTPILGKTSSVNIVRDRFFEHTDVIDGEIKLLAEEANALLILLLDLDNHLMAINSIAAQDKNYADRAKAEILAELWSKLGGNKAKIRELESQLDLLRDIDENRKLAVEHVRRTMVKLEEIGEELERVRESIRNPQLSIGRAFMPLGEQIELIEMRVERLNGVRMETREAILADAMRVLDREEETVKNSRNRIESR